MGILVVIIVRPSNREALSLHHSASMGITGGPHDQHDLKRDKNIEANKH